MLEKIIQKMNKNLSKLHVEKPPDSTSARTHDYVVSSSPKPAKRCSILNIQLDNLTMKQALIRIGEMVSENQPHLIVTANIDHLVTLQEDTEFRNIYRNASLALCDSTFVLWASYLLGNPLKERVAGSDLVPKLCALAAHRKWRIFFLGGDPGVAEQASAVLRRQYPQLPEIGIYSPPFGFEKDDAQFSKSVDAVREHDSDIVFVALGAPKQEKWVVRAMPLLHSKVYLGVGASLDFIAGTRKRAPVWMRYSGFEWFHRMSQEPGRLWKRYLLRDPRFFWLVLLQVMGKYKTPVD